MSASKVAILFGSIVLAIGIYAWWWNGEVDAVAERFDAAFAQWLPVGSVVSYRIDDSGGFPYRISHKLTDVSVAIPEYGAFEISSLELIHQPWTKGHMVIHFEGEVHRFDSQHAPVWTLLANKNLASLVGYTSDRASFDMDMRGIELRSNQGTMDVPELQYHARTQGRFGDESTEISIVTKTEGVPSLF